MASTTENQDRFIHKITRPAHSGLYFVTYYHLKFCLTFCVQVQLSPAAARDLGLLQASHINITEWRKTPSK